MVVYIDVLIFTNIIINYCILSATKKFIHIQNNEWRIILSSVIGSLFTFVIFIPKLSSILSFFIKLICSATMSLTGFGFRNIRYFLKSVFLIFTITVVFSSTMLAVCNVFKPDRMAIVNDVVYFQIDSILLILLSILSYFLIILIQTLFCTDLTNTLVNLKFKLQNKEFSCIGKIDTGCSLTEPFSKSPVIIVEKSLFKDTHINTERIIPYNSLGKSGVIYGVKAQNLVIDNKNIDKDVYIALYDSSIDPNFNAIINHNILR